MSDEKGYTIGELAQAADVTVRTIRYYVAEEVLPPPVGSSRAAVYTEEHLSRLQLIKILKEEFLPLQEIRALLSGLDHQAVLELLAERGRSEAPPPPTPNSAKEYLQTLLGPPAEAPGLMRHKVESHQTRSGVIAENHLSVPAPARDTSPGLGFTQADKAAPPPEAQATSDLWQRIELAPGVELHVKAEAVAPSLRSKIEHLVKVAHQLLTSKQSHL